MNSTAALASPLIAALGILSGVVGALGAWLGLVPPLLGLGLVFLMLLILVLAALVGLVGMLRTRGGVRGGRSQALGGTLLSLAVLVLFAGLGREPVQAPPIHDISTSIEDPPAFHAARDLDSRGNAFAYPSGGDHVPDMQRAAYPDLHTLHLDINPAEARWRVDHTAREIGWELLHHDDESGYHEYQDVTEVFRFIDFVAVRVKPDGDGSAIDIRSVSQVGEGDLGENAARIRRFIAHIDDAHVH